MTIPAAETVPAEKEPKVDGVAEKKANRVRRAGTTSDDGKNEKNGSRYFLSKTNGTNGTPVLDREVASEGEAVVEALRLGVTFCVVQEFRVVPDFSGRKPQLNQEPINVK